MKATFLALLPVALLALSSCSTTIPGEQNTAVKTSGTSTTVVDTFKATATVTSIDRKNRKLSLKFTDGRSKTVKCGPEVVNFPSIDVNDRVIVTVTEETAVYLDKGKPLAGASAASTVTLAPLGAKPGVLTSDTVEATVKISAIDATARKVTFRTKDGSTDTVKVSDHIDLNKVKVGDSVTIRRTEAMALFVETP